MNSLKRFRQTRYLISKDGKVWSERTKRFLAQTNKMGYRIVGLHRKIYHVHRLVAECYIENTNEYDYVNHINNNRSDNRVENLEWCTMQMNIDHRNNQNRQSKGINRPANKLSESQVIEIKTKYSTNNITMLELAKIYKVCRTTIFDIISGKTWKYLKD